MAGEVGGKRCDRIRFRAWEKDKGGRASEIASVLQRQLLCDNKEARQFQSAINAMKFGLANGQSLLFEVIDVGPRDVQAVELEAALRGILIGSQSVAEGEGEIVRLLLVGKTLSLDEWEEEAPGLGRSIKKDVELLARSLRVQDDVAHYIQLLVHGDPNADTGRAVEEAEETAFAQSAILALLRKYRHPGAKPLSEALGVRSKAVRTLLLPAGRRLQGFEQLGALDKDLSDFDTLLQEINLVAQFGKRHDKIVKDGLDLLRKTSDFITYASYDVRRERSALLEIADATDRRAGDSTPVDGKLKQLEINLKRYELLRDLGRLLGSQAIERLREFPHDLKEKAGYPDKGWSFPAAQGPILIIDDALHGALSVPGGAAQGYPRKLYEIMQLIDWDDRVAVASTNIIPGKLDFTWPADVDQAQHQPRGLLRLDGHPAGSITLEDFSVILIDLDSQGAYVGPAALPRLTNYLRKFGELPDETQESKKRWIAPVVVLTAAESAGTIQQSFHLGAAQYVNKGRLYQLPFQLLRAIYAHSNEHRDETPIASHFEALNALKPDVAAKLKQTEPPSYILGGMPTTDPDDVYIDKREEAWVRSLPKADLHCHLGTCIDYAAIEVMALNTVGYLLWVPPAPSPALATSFDRVFLRIAKAVVLSEWLHSSLSIEGYRVEPLHALAIAAQLVGEGPLIKQAKFGLGDDIAKRLAGSNDRVEDFEIAAIIAALMGSGPRQDTGARIADPRNYLSNIASQFVERHQTEAPRTGAARKTHNAIFSSEEAFQHATQEAMVQLKRTTSRWRGTFTRDAARLGLSASLGSRQQGWKTLASEFGKRVQTAQDEIAKARKSAEHWLYCDDTWKEKGWKQLVNAAATLAEARLPDSFSMPAPGQMDKHEASRLPLARYVIIPDTNHIKRESGQTGLQRYLFGADLLGSAYLQYPDNLLVAAYALTHDNARDNVLYNEVRCETTGYTRAGMNAQDATDLLCHAFDIASLFLQVHPSGQGLPLVRTNILLAAKRHKREEAAREAVTLMETYLQRRPGSAQERFSRNRYKMHFPGWWRPSEVVGFDISGDESQEAEWLHGLLKPLARHSSPITIHAGEAASAQSIWSAVYDLNATRIGHGLRLAEDSALLTYCVREGICMEMCPNSNSFTNGFGQEERVRSPRHVYPLLTYMRQGLEVCISTDNRYLHAEGRQTLTSEYLTAARLTGGLTRWEILQIVKAGFKNAFLDKSEVHALVTEAEDRIYQIVARGWV